MYEAMRQRARFSTRVTGLSATFLIAAAAGYVLLTGFGAVIVEAVQRPMVMATIPARPVPPDHTTPPPTTPDERLFRLPAPPPEAFPDDRFVTDDKPGTDDPSLVEPKKDTLVSPTHTPVRVAPRMKPMAPPPYPAAAIRASEQGTTALELCIDAHGRVTSANLARSSGHPRLDEAALKWVREARYAPAMVDGAAQPLCGHPVEYVWNLETLRR
jgi:protein TonB